MVNFIISILADACFKAASIMLRDFPATIEIDGHMINTEQILVSYIKEMLSILLVVPVTNLNYYAMAKTTIVHIMCTHRTVLIKKFFTK